MSCTANNIKIEPVDVQWQIEEQWHITTVADVASSSNNNYFILSTPSGGLFHVWLDVNNTGVDPAPSGSTAIEVNIAVGATAAAIATAIAAAVDAHADFHAEASGATVTITADAAGDVSDWSDGPGGNATGFTFSQCQEGGDDYLGLLDGDVEVAFEESLLEVTAHQTGVTLLADLRQGTIATINLTLKECDLPNLKKIFSKASGGSYTPSGGTELFGWGVSRQGLSTLLQSRRLIMHPVAVDDADLSQDLCFWKAYPLPDTLVFSGENPKTLGVSFKTYIDTGKPEAIRQFAFGDWSQLVPVTP